MVLPDGTIVGTGDQFDLPYTDDVAGRERVQEYVEKGTVDLAQVEPSWWVNRTATIKVKVLAPEFHYAGVDGVGGVARRGQVIALPCSRNLVEPRQNGMTERALVMHLVGTGLLMLAETKPGWWLGAIGQDLFGDNPAPFVG